MKLFYHPIWMQSRADIAAFGQHLSSDQHIKTPYDLLKGLRKRYTEIIRDSESGGSDIRQIYWDHFGGDCYWPEEMPELVADSTLSSELFNKAFLKLVSKAEEGSLTEYVYSTKEAAELIDIDFVKLSKALYFVGTSVVRKELA